MIYITLQAIMSIEENFCRFSSIFPWKTLKFYSTSTSKVTSVEESLSLIKNATLLHTDHRISNIFSILF